MHTQEFSRHQASGDQGGVQWWRITASPESSSRPTTRIAAAGGIDAGNAATYAEAGAHILVTSAPYFAHPRDVAVTLHAGY